MPERLTERARKVMSLANQEARRLHHEYISTEHLLLGIIQEGGGIAASALRSLGLDFGKIRAEVEQLAPAGRDSANIGKLPQSPEARKVLELAAEEARGQHHSYVGTEHLLIGMLLKTDSIAARVLTQLGITVAAARQEIDELLSPEAAGPADTSGHLIRRAVECLLRARDAATAEGNTARAAELQNQALSVGAILIRRPEPGASANEPTA
jgi:ATP-dependent Clp protease ATP-binding subunit ClpC